jgi:hypothetical protein
MKINDLNCPTKIITEKLKILLYSRPLNVTVFIGLAIPIASDQQINFQKNIFSSKQNV